MPRLIRSFTSLSFLIALLAGLTAATAQDRDASVEIAKVVDGIYMITGRGGNIGLSVGNDTAFLIDDKFAPMTENIMAAVATVTDMPVEFVINTHWHWDHVGGNENFGKAGTVILSHDNVRKRMAMPDARPGDGDTREPYPKEALPIITFDSAVTFHLNGQTFRAYHPPRAHTDGDAIIHFESHNVIHMGDTFFSGRYPFVDIASGGTVDGFIAAMESGLALADEETKIIPGHGPLSGKAELAASVAMLKDVRSRVAAGIASGKPLEDLLAEEPLADLEEAWAWGFINGERIYTAVYNDLSSAGE